MFDWDERNEEIKKELGLWYIPNLRYTWYKKFITQKKFDPKTTILLGYRVKIVESYSDQVKTGLQTFVEFLDKEDFYDNFEMYKESDFMESIIEQIETTFDCVVQDGKLYGISFYEE